jgi:hypothetical protein
MIGVSYVSIESVDPALLQLVHLLESYSALARPCGLATSKEEPHANFYLPSRVRSSAAVRVSQIPPKLSKMAGVSLSFVTLKAFCGL